MGTKFSLCLFSLLAILRTEAVSQNWDVLGPVFDREIRELYVSGNSSKMFIGGSFKFADGTLANGITVWEGDGFDSLGSGASNCSNFCGPILSITEYDGNLYAGGHIFEMGGVPSEGIARWNGQEWESVGNGLNGYASEMAVIDGLLYVGGGYDAAGGTPANGLATWDGAQWQTVGDFPNTWGGGNWMSVSSIKQFNNEIYVAGLFPEGEGISHSIARWDGAQWLTVGESIQGVDVWINDMEVYQGELYVAGYFFQLYGNASSGILKWNGSSWSGIGSGVEFGGQVSDLQVFDDHLYACGSFNTVSGVPTGSIAKWNGNQWCGIGGVENIRRMAVFQNELHVSYRTETDSLQVTLLDKWIGGDYVDTCGALTDIGELPNSNESVLSYPNPSHGPFTLTWQGTAAESYSLTFYDAQGRAVQTHSGQTTAGHNAVQLELSHLPSGIYFGRLAAGDGVRSFKWVME